VASFFAFFSDGQAFSVRLEFLPRLALMRQSPALSPYRILMKSCAFRCSANSFVNNIMSVVFVVPETPGTSLLQEDLQEAFPRPTFEAILCFPAGPKCEPNTRRPAR